MNELPPAHLSAHVRGPEPGPVAFLTTTTLAKTVIADEASLLVWLAAAMGTPHAEATRHWWLHLEHVDDGYAVGRQGAAGWVTEATTAIVPNRILDGRCFSADAEIRFWWDTSGITGVRLDRSGTLGPGYPPAFGPALSPREDDYLTIAGETTRARSPQGFQRLTFTNGQTTLIPCPNDGTYTLGTRTYYRADPGTGLVSIGAVCATGYKKAQHD